MRKVITYHKNKLGNKRIVVDGAAFDSHAEATRYGQLRLLEKAGQITDLERQKVYELIPAAYEIVPTGEIYRRGAKKGEPKVKRVCVELGVNYIADFVYKDRAGNTVVEDVKGYRDPSSAPYAKFVIKRKLMLWRYGIKVKEVKV